MWANNLLISEGRVYEGIDFEVWQFSRPRSPICPPSDLLVMVQAQDQLGLPTCFTAIQISRAVLDWPTCTGLMSPIYMTGLIDLLSDEKELIVNYLSQRSPEALIAGIERGYLSL